MVKAKSVFNEIIDLYNDNCALEIYSLKDGFLLQVFNTNDIYFSIKKKGCLIRLKKNAILNMGLNVFEANLIGRKKRIRSDTDNIRIGLTKKLNELNGSIYHNIKPMEFQCYLITLK